MDLVGTAAPTVTHPDVATAVHIVSLPEGLYSLAVRPAARPSARPDDLVLPALHISEAPSVEKSSRLELLPAPHLIGNWLTQPGDAIVARISGGSCQVLITSLTQPGVIPLAIEVRRIDQRVNSALPALGGRPMSGLNTTAIIEGSNIPAGSPVPAAERATMFEDGKRVLLPSIAVHIQNRGDQQHDGDGWAGVVDERLSIEAYALGGLDGDLRDAMEYKSITASGFETPWLSKGAWCGTRGMGIPLVGISIRLKPALAAQYCCEYSAAFKSGLIAEVCSDGVSCRSAEEDDPIIGIKLRLIERAASLDVASDTTLQEPAQLPGDAENQIVRTAR